MALGSVRNSHQSILKAAVCTAAAKANFVPQTVSMSNPKSCSCSEWQQSGLRLQHMGWMLDVGFGPSLSVGSGPIPNGVVMRLMAAESPSCNLSALQRKSVS